MIRAFVAGATGYTGREVVRQLVQRGVHAVAHVRPDSSRLAEWSERFARMGAVVDTTPWQLHEIKKAMKAHTPDVAFALLGTTQARARAERRAGRTGSDYETVDYGMTHMLLEAVRTEAPHARFVYLSSLGARTNTGNEYLRVRGRIESELMTSGITYVVARPAFISGPDREEKRLLERAGAIGSDAAFSLLARLGAPRVRMRFGSISSTRLAGALIDAALDPAAANTVLNAEALQQRAGRV